MPGITCEPVSELTELMRGIEGLSPYWVLIGIRIEAVGRDCAIGAINIEGR